MIASRGASRRGMALLVVLTLLAALSVTAIYLYVFSTRQRYQSHRLSSGETAMHAAEFAARQTCRLIRSSIDFINSSSPATFPKNSSKAPPNLRAFLENFTTSDGRLKPEKKLQFLLTNDTFDLLNRTILDEHASNLKLKILVTHEKLTDPAWDAVAIPGLIGGFDHEGRSRFIVDVSATFSDTTRRVISILHAQQFNLSWPVIGRFVLYANQMVPEPIEEHLNKIIHTLSGNEIPKLVENFSSFSDGIEPLIIRAGKVVDDAMHLELTSDAEKRADYLNRQGWVLLGGPEMIFGLAPGCDANGEHFLLAGDVVFLRTIVRNVNPFGYEAAHPNPDENSDFRFRLWETHEIYSLMTGLFKEARNNNRRVFLSHFPDAEISRASLLRLMGTASAPSPTLVFGPVFRRYILEQGLRKKASGSSSPAPCPYVSKENFYESVWMDGYEVDITKILRDTCNGDWDNGYRLAMSYPVCTPYNEGLACWLTPYAQMSKAEQSMPVFREVSTGMIAKLGKTLTFNPPESSENPAFSLGEEYNLFRGSEKVFSGKLQDILPAIRNLAIARCGRKFASEADLRKYLNHLTENGGSTVGIYRVEQSFQWTDEFNDLALGGFGVVCDGGITIDAPVKPRPSGRFPDSVNNIITLVALKGDISVGKGLNVCASLLAPSGKLILSGGCNIEGLVAVRELELCCLATGEKKALIYDPAHDWTEKESFERGYRIMLEEDPVIFPAKPF